MKKWRRGKLSGVCIQLAREPKGGGHSRHGQRDQMVEVTVCGSGQLECSEADVIESLVVNAKSLISVLHQMVYGECGIVRLYHRV